LLKQFRGLASVGVYGLWCGRATIHQHLNEAGRENERDKEIKRTRQKKVTTWWLRNITPFI